MLPAPPAATQNAVVAHETDWRVEANESKSQVAEPPIGSVEVQESVPVTATHSGVAGHEMPLKTGKPVNGPICVVVQAEADPFGFVDVTTLPLSSAPTQNVSVAHESPRITDPASGPLSA